MDLRKTAVIPFASASAYDPHIILKVGLQSISLTETGVGAGATVTGTSFEFGRGGITAPTLGDVIEYA